MNVMCASVKGVCCGGRHRFRELRPVILGLDKKFYNAEKETLTQS